MDDSPMKPIIDILLSVNKKMDPHHELIVYHPQASYILNKPYWMVRKDMTVYFPGVDGIDRVMIPKGYLSDGITMPSNRLRFLTHWRRSAKAILVHDILCETREAMCNNERVTVSRRQADRIMYQIMKQEGIPWWERKLFYTGVRIYGLFNSKHKPKRYKAKQLIEKELRRDWDQTEKEMNRWFMKLQQLRSSMY